MNPSVSLSAIFHDVHTPPVNQRAQQRDQQDGNRSPAHHRLTIGLPHSIRRRRHRTTGRTAGSNRSQPPSRRLTLRLAWLRWILRMRLLHLAGPGLAEIALVAVDSGGAVLLG